MAAKNKGRMAELYRPIPWGGQLTGPLAKGDCLKCLGPDRTDMALSNWKVVPRGMLPRLNNRWGRDYDNAAPELKPTIMAIAKLEHHARAAAKRDRA